MADQVRPTDPASEVEQGRVPLWLDADVGRLLAKRCNCGQRSAGQLRSAVARFSAERVNDVAAMTYRRKRWSGR